ncbi:MAG: hypothetical protein ABSH45_07870 [Bryobacteraceae bacterium]|jgi:hypothetical protein
MSTQPVTPAPTQNIYDEIYEWAMQAVALIESEFGITVTLTVQTLYLSGITADPNTGLSYINFITAISPSYPQAPYQIANCLYGTFAWTPAQLANSILGTMALMSGQPFPPPKAANPTVTPAPTPVVSNPVGAAVGDGYYDNAAPTVYTAAGQTYTAGDGTVCVLVSINSIFGPNNYWTVKTAAPAAA